MQNESETEFDRVYKVSPTERLTKLTHLLRESGDFCNMWHVTCLTVTVTCPAPSSGRRVDVSKHLQMVHPSIFVYLSGAGSQGQLPEQGRPDFPLPGYFLQLFREDPKAFPGQLGDIVTPACPGSSSGSPPRGACQEHLPREPTRPHHQRKAEMKSSGSRTRSPPACGCA